jgi:ABC-type branched-subunit amino acid transport system substrate-binding protein
LLVVSMAASNNASHRDEWKIKMNRRDWCRALAAGVATTMLGSQAAPAPGDVVVAQIGPFTGLPVADAHHLNEGATAYFAHLNARGGIGGRAVKLVTLDDTYKPEGFVKAFEEAMRHKPVALLSPVGSIVLRKMFDDKLLDKSDVIVLNAVPGAEAFRSPGHPKLFHVRAGDKQQIDKIVALMPTMSVSRLAVLHQDIPTGTSGLAMAKEAATRWGTQIVAVSSSEEPAALAAASAQVVASGAQAALVLGAPPFMANGIASLRKAGAAYLIYALSYATPTLVAKAAGPGARGVALSQAFPNPASQTMPLQREFHAAMKDAHPKIAVYTPFHLEGYITAKTFAEAARRAKDVTPEQIGRALRSMGELDLGGFRVDFSQSNNGGRFVDVGVINADGRLIH